MSKTVAITGPKDDALAERGALPDGAQMVRIDGPFFAGVAAELMDI